MGLAVGSCSRTLTNIVISIMIIWWVAAAIVLTRCTNNADAALNPPESNATAISGWRKAVCVLSWTEVAAWGLLLMIEGLLSVVKHIAHRSMGTSHILPYRNAAQDDEYHAIETRPSAPLPQVIVSSS